MHQHLKIKYRIFLYFRNGEHLGAMEVRHGGFHPRSKMLSTLDKIIVQSKQDVQWAVIISDGNQVVVLAVSPLALVLQLMAMALLL